jgi:integrase
MPSLKLFKVEHSACCLNPSTLNLQPSTKKWFFPAPTLTFIPKLREQRRYHLHESHVQGAVKQAAARAAIPKRVSPHTFRHTYASHLLLADYDLQTIQKLLGHSDIKTTMIYLQTVPGVTLKEAKSPLDLDPTLG